MRTVLFSSSNGDVPVNMAFINKFDGTVDPGVGNDSTQGYQAGSIWINSTAGRAFTCVSATVGAAVWNETGSSGTPGQLLANDAATPTANGGTALVKAGKGGATSGNGGPVNNTGGAAQGGNGNGGSVVSTPGAKNGTGVDGMIIDRGVKLVHQGAATAKTVSATLTAAEVLAGIITVNQGSSGASAQQLPLATAMDTAMPDSIAGDAFDFSLINISVTAAEAASITINTGWTLVGDMDVVANSASTTKSAGRFRAAKTATGAWTLFRLS